MDEGKTCAMCNHEHKKADGTCECGCAVTSGMSEIKVCPACGHEHKKDDGTCDCGCNQH